MNKTMTQKQSHQTRNLYISVNGHHGHRRTLDVKLSRSFMFADLRGRIFDRIDLSNFEFFGCLLNGASFRGTLLRDARFIGCFSSNQSPPTDFTKSLWQNTSATGCHLNYLFDQDIPGFDCWPTELVETAEKTLSRRNDVRNRAVVRLGALGTPVVAPYLANFLADEEWDVRLVALEALVLLRQQKFPYRDQELMKQMFLSLGDEYRIVQDVTTKLIQTLRPSDDVLRFAVSRMSASSSEATLAERTEEKLAGLRAAAELYEFDEDYLSLFALETLHQLLSDDSPLVRAECLHVLGILDEPDTLPWVLECISDPNASVRTDAIRTVGWLSELAETHEIEHLLYDMDENVRLQTLYTLEESELLELKHLSLALADSSPKVVRAARHMQVEPEREAVGTSFDATDEPTSVYAQSRLSEGRASFLSARTRLASPHLVPALP